MDERFPNTELGPQITGGGVALAEQVVIGDIYNAATDPPINPPGPVQPRIPKPSPEKPDGRPHPGPINPPSRV